jgi:hypothetical protein
LKQVTLLLPKRNQFSYAALPVASACRAARRTARRRLPRVARLVPRLVTRLVVPLVVDFSASRRLVVDYFTSAACPGASARRVARRAARSRQLRLRRASGCLGTSRLVVDFFAYIMRPGASARRAAHRRQRRLPQARRRLLRLRRASGCLGTSRGSSRGLLLTTSTMSCV